MASIAKDLDLPVERRGAIIDSGATSHFCPDRSKFLTFTSIDPQSIHTADGSTISAIGRGDVKIDLPLGQKRTTVTLKDALYAPKMAFTLVATNRIAAVGFAVHFEGNLCKILSAGPIRTIIAEIPHINGLYTVVAQNKHHAATARGKLTICDLHRVLGHVSQLAIKSAVEKGLIEGVEFDSTSKPEFCDGCEKGKATRQPFPKESKRRATAYGELIHTDLWGPAQTVSIGGSS
jgi:hypothetical protein